MGKLTDKVTVSEVEQISEGFFGDWLDAVAAGKEECSALSPAQASVVQEVIEIAFERGSRWEMLINGIRRGMSPEMAIVYAMTTDPGEKGAEVRERMRRREQAESDATAADLLKGVDL